MDQNKETIPEKKPHRIKQDILEFQKQLVTQMLSLSTSGFGLVAALAWNNVIQEFVNTYVKKWLPNQSGIISLLVYALIVTFLAVFVTYQLSKVSQRLQSQK